jgi:transcriptional regulator with XRE-family HTH domain
MSPSTPDALRAMREELGLTQAELGEVLGVGRSTVSNRERGLVPIIPETVLALQKLLQERKA